MRKNEKLSTQKGHKGKYTEETKRKKKRKWNKMVKKYK